MVSEERIHEVRPMLLLVIYVPAAEVARWIANSSSDASSCSHLTRFAARLAEWSLGLGRYGDYGLVAAAIGVLNVR